MNNQTEKLLDELRNVVKYINEQYPNQEFEKGTFEKMLTEWAGNDRRTVRKYLDVMYEYFLALTPPDDEPQPKKRGKSTKREKRTGTKAIPLHITLGPSCDGGSALWKVDSAAWFWCDALQHERVEGG